MSKYEIYNQSFTSQGGAKSYVREVLRRWESGQRLTDDRNFLLALCARHPEHKTKAPDGISHFWVRRNPRNQKALELYLVRPDMSEIDISWLTCIKGIGSTKEQDLIRAMRASIRGQILTFKASEAGAPCAICGQYAFDFDGEHIDHHEPEFRHLVEQFLSQTLQPRPTTFIDDPTYNDPVFQAWDSDFLNEWLSYHQTNAKLRMTCARCNLSKGRAA